MYSRAVEQLVHFFEFLCCFNASHATAGDSKLNYTCSFHYSQLNKSLGLLFSFEYSVKVSVTISERQVNINQSMIPSSQSCFKFLSLSHSNSHNTRLRVVALTANGSMILCCFAV